MSRIRNLKTLQAVLAVIGLLNAIYLTVAKLSNDKALCVPGLGDCWTVNNSRYSELFGIPVAILGAGAFLTLLGLLWLENQTDFGRNYSVIAIFGVSLVGILYSAYLTYLEIAVIQAICPFCVLSATVMVVIFAIAVIRLLKSTSLQADIKN